MLRSNKFAILVVVTVLTVITAVILGDRNTPTMSTEKELLFPELMDKVNDVARIKIQEQMDSIRLVKEEGSWLVQEADNYPADFGKIRQTVIALAELRIDSAKTRNPDNFPSLGVEDPEGEGAESTLLTVIDSSNRVLVSLIVGNNRKSSSAITNPGLYVRLPEQDQALLVNGALDISSSVTDWIDTELMDIVASRIRQVEINHPGEDSIRLIRDTEEDDFRLENIPDGKEIKSAYTLNRQEDILGSIRVDGVRSAENFMFPDTAIETRVTTYDGMQVIIRGTTVEDKNYATFQFLEQTEDLPEQDDESQNIKAEIDSLINRTEGWVYEVPGYKFDLMSRNLDDLLDDIEPEEEGEEQSE